MLPVLKTKTVNYCTWQSTTIPMSGASYPLTFSHPFACYSLTLLLARKHTQRNTVESWYSFLLTGGKQVATQHTNLKQQSETKQNVNYTHCRNLKLVKVSSIFIVRNIIKNQTTHQPDTWKKKIYIIMESIRKQKRQTVFSQQSHGTH